MGQLGRFGLCSLWIGKDDLIRSVVANHGPVVVSLFVVDVAVVDVVVVVLVVFDWWVNHQ